jgi:hypothetical protein
MGFRSFVSSLLGSKFSKKNGSARTNARKSGSEQQPAEEQKRKRSRMSEYPLRAEPEYTTKARPASSVPLESKQKRYSLSSRLSRRISDYTIGNIRHSGEGAPPRVPAIPAQYQQNSQTPPTTARLPASRRAHSSSKNLVLPSDRSDSTSHRRNSRLWQSSNPEVDDLQRSPVSSRDTTTENLLTTGSRSTLSVSRNNSSDTAGSATTRDSRATTSCYIPRSAAKGFLSSTSGASSEAKREWRRSAALLIGGGGDRNSGAPIDICLTDEHTREWEHLKARMPAFDARPVMLLDVGEVSRRLEGRGEVDEREYEEILEARRHALAALEQRI